MKRKLVICFLVFISIFAAVISTAICTIVVATAAQDINIANDGPVFIFRIDNSFTEEERQHIIGAFKMWEEASNNRVSFIWYYDNISITDMFKWREDWVLTIYKSSSRLGWSRFMAQFLTQSYNILGVTAIGPGDIFLIEGNTYRQQAVIAHELGHVLIGSYHSADQNSIMYPMIGKKVDHMKITYDELYALQKRFP